MKKLTIIILILFSLPLAAIQNQFLLRLGAELAFCTSEPNDEEGEDEEEDDDQSNSVYNAGIATQFGYIFTNYEFGISTHISSGAINNFRLAKSGESLQGSGTITMEKFGLYVKRYINLYPIKFWRFYGAFGPSVVFSTIKLREFTSSSTQFTHNHKITSDSVGGTIAIGIEEHALKKSSHPNYIQISYSVHRPTKFTIVDATDYTKVENIYQSDTGIAMAVHTFMVEAGFVLF